MHTYSKLCFRDLRTIIPHAILIEVILSYRIVSYRITKRRTFGNADKHAIQEKSQRIFVQRPFRTVRKTSIAKLA